MCKPFLVAVLFLLCFAASAQDSTFLPRAIAKMAGQPAQEKVYLHLDKPNYGYGDTIWYKAYTVVGQKHQLSALSGVLYVELLSPKDSLVTRQAVPMLSGIGWSDIPLAHSLKQGIYRIRAYTRWMQNLGPDYFYDQKVRVGGIRLSITKQAAKENPDVQFFPEGGDLVTGVRSRVAVKVVGANGLGQDIKGTVEDNTGTVVADFATKHLGMCVFALLPEGGKTYKAKINVPGEATYSIDLPLAKQTGYTIAINNTEKDSIYLKIATNEQTLTLDKDKTFYIIAQNSGKVYYATQGKLEGTAYMARVEKSRFPEGITQFTLFNQSGEPLAERIVFVDNEKNELNLALNTSAQTYTTRVPVKLTLTAKSDSSKTVSGSFSVSVINESEVLPDENSENSIESNLLLTSELKGYVEQPNYYFANKNDQTKVDLDILMLTQGYSRFEWKHILDNKLQILPYKPQPTQELSGILTTPAGKPVPNGKVTLAATKQNLFIDTTADADGKFTFTDLSFIDTATVVIKARKANNGSNVIIKALLPDYPKITPSYNIAEALSIDTTRQTLPKQQFTDYQKQQTDESLKNGKTLNTVTITDIKRPPKPDMSRSSNMHGGGNADHVIMGKDLGICPNLADCLAYKLVGINFNAMSVIVDGSNIGVGHINEISPNLVYSIEVLSSTFSTSIYGSSIAKAGALIITLKNSSEQANDARPMETAGRLQYSQYEKEQKEDSLKNGKTLKTVNIKGFKRATPPDMSRSSNLHGGGNADRVIMGTDLGHCINLADCLGDKLIGIPYQGMSVIVDGVNLGVGRINDVNMADVYSVEVLYHVNAKALYGSSIAKAGALIITLKNGSEQANSAKTTETAGRLQYSQYEKDQKEDSLKNGKTLKTVTIKAVKHPKQPDLTLSANLNGPGHADQVVMYDQLGTCIDLTDCLTGHVFGVNFANGKATSTRSLSRLTGGGITHMRIIVDGSMLDPGASLNDLNPNDIYSVEVLRSGNYLSIYGSEAPLGALVITMKHGGEGTAYYTQLQPNGIMTFPFPGFYKAKAFYTPKYEHKNTGQPDNRTTIYWKPNILTDKDGKASIEYFNNDTKGTYRVVVEGIDDDGNLGRAVYRYKVE
jgi:TonB-dependent Receptor Plug Domain